MDNNFLMPEYEDDEETPIFMPEKNEEPNTQLEEEKVIEPVVSGEMIMPDYDEDDVVTDTQIVEDTTTGGRGRSYRTDYGHPIFRMSSANGTKWWIQLGYGLDGHSFKIWSDTIGNQLIGNWTLEFGTWTSDNSANIDFCHLGLNDHFVPSACSIAYYVSNNNGSTWEAYTLNSIHSFSSSGTQLRVKYVASGQPNKAPYKSSYFGDQVTFGSLYTGLLDNTIPTKVVRRKIRGRKS